MAELQRPSCPRGCGPTGLPLAWRSNAATGPRLCCVACSWTWRGSDAEVWSARQAEAARDLRAAREEKAPESAKDRELRKKMEAAKAGRWQ